MRIPAFPVERSGRRFGRPSVGPVERAIIWFIVGDAVLSFAVLTRPALAPVNLVPILVVVAALCVIELTRRPAPNLAWLAAIGGAYAVRRCRSSRRERRIPERSESGRGWRGRFRRRSVP